MAKTTSVKGSVFDLVTLKSLPDDNCNVLLVSDRTLFLLQTVAKNELTWPTRYGVLGDFSLYAPAESSDDLDFVNITGASAQKELINMTCDFVGVLTGIKNALLAISSSSCCSEIGQGADTGSSEQGGDVPAPIGDIEFQEPVSITDRKCKAANAIAAMLGGAFTGLAAYPLPNWALATLVVCVAAVTAIFGLLAAPLVALVAGVAGSVIVFAARLKLGDIDLENIASTLEDNYESLVCALYYATTSEGAKNEYLAVLESAGLTDTELEVVSLLMTNGLLAVLFFDTDDTSDYLDNFEATVDCASCSVDEPFILDYGSGTFRYDGVSFTLTSEDIGAYHLLQFQNYDTVTCPSGNWCVEFTATTIDEGLGGSWTRQYGCWYDTSCGVAIGSYPDAFAPLDYPALIGLAAMSNPYEFTVTLTIYPGLRGLGDGTHPYSGNNDCE